VTPEGRRRPLPKASGAATGATPPYTSRPDCNGGRPAQQVSHSPLQLLNLSDAQRQAAAYISGTLSALRRQCGVARVDVGQENVHKCYCVQAAAVVSTLVMPSSLEAIATTLNLKPHTTRPPYNAN
jgi:hypothetical protein